VARVTKRRLMILLLCAAAISVGVLAWILHEPALYRVTVLPSPRGQTIAYSVNDLGQIAGLAHAGANKYLFVWDRENGMRDLGPIAALPVTIDNRGRIAGTMRMAPDGRQAFVWEPGKGRTEIGALGGRESTAKAMNNCGQVVGEFRDANGVSYAFLWDNATGMKKLSAPDGNPCTAASINDAGQILVASFPSPPPGVHWFLLCPNETIAIDGVQESLYLRNVNSSSSMGGVDKSDGHPDRVILRQRRATLRWLPSAIAVLSVTRLNDKDQIAYTEFRDRRWLESLQYRISRRVHVTSETVSYLWDPVRGRVPLNRYLRGMRKFCVEDMSNNGWIIGTATMKDGHIRSVLLEPIPERWRK
jgi:probable HAF family extracellular repeat protein